MAIFSLITLPVKIIVYVFICEFIKNRNHSLILYYFNIKYTNYP